MVRDLSLICGPLNLPRKALGLFPQSKAAGREAVRSVEHGDGSTPRATAAGTRQRYQKDNCRLSSKGHAQEGNLGGAGHRHSTRIPQGTDTARRSHRAQTQHDDPTGHSTARGSHRAQTQHEDPTGHRHSTRIPQGTDTARRYHRAQFTLAHYEQTKQTPRPLVRKRTLSTEQPTLVSEI
jgi:hypothetical protein